MRRRRSGGRKKKPALPESRLERVGCVGGILLIAALTGLLAPRRPPEVEPIDAGGGPGQPPAAILGRPDGRLYVADPQYVRILAPHQQARPFHDLVLPNPSALAPAPDEALYEADLEGVWRLGPGSTRTRAYQGPWSRRRYGVVALAAGARKGLWVLEREEANAIGPRWRAPGEPARDRLALVPPGGPARVVAEGPGLFRGSRGLALTPAGTALVVGDAGRELIEIDPTGRRRRAPLAWADAAGGVTAIAFAPDDRLYAGAGTMLAAIGPDARHTVLNWTYKPAEGERPAPGPGLLSSADFGAIAAITAAEQGVLYVLGRPLWRVRLPRRPKQLPWPAIGAALPDWSAWVRPAHADPGLAEVREPETAAHPRPLPRPVQLPVLDDVVVGEDVFDAAARLRRRLAVAGRDANAIPAFRGPVLGIPGCRVALAPTWHGGPLVDASWPLERLTIQLPVAGPQELAPRFLQAARALTRAYGVGQDFAEIDVPHSAVKAYPRMITPVPAQLPAAAARDVAARELALTVRWRRPGKTVIDLDITRPPAAAGVTVTLGPLTD